MNLPALALSLALSVPSAPLQQGQVAPFAGVLSDVETVQAVARRIRSAEAERDDLRRQLLERKPDPTGYVIGALVGALLGAGAVLWITNRK